MTLVYYYVPEDKDDPDYPNVFSVKLPKAQLRYSHIQEQFPLKGEYIFRFKVQHENNVFWLDLPDRNNKLPTFKDKVFVKATRISWDDNNNISNNVPGYRSTTQELLQTEAPPRKPLVSDRPAPAPVYQAPVSQPVPNLLEADLLGGSVNSTATATSPVQPAKFMNIGNDLLI